MVTLIRNIEVLYIFLCMTCVSRLEHQCDAWLYCLVVSGRTSISCSDSLSTRICPWLDTLLAALVSMTRSDGLSDA